MLDLKCIVGGSIQTNCYLVKKERQIILFDFVPEVIPLIKENQYQLDMVLLTHGHFDHFEGLAHFQREYDFKIMLSDFFYRFIKEKRYQHIPYFDPAIISLHEIDLKNAAILKDQQIIQWQGLDIKVLESPGHSPDCLMFCLENEKTVITGDTIFNLSVGRADLPGGNFEQLLESIARFYRMYPDCDFQLYPGHGPKTSMLFEKNNNPFFGQRPSGDDNW